MNVRNIIVELSAKRVSAIARGYTLCNGVFDGVCGSTHPNWSFAVQILPTEKPKLEPGDILTAIVTLCWRCELEEITPSHRWEIDTIIGPGTFTRLTQDV